MQVDKRLKRKDGTRKMLLTISDDAHITALGLAILYKTTLSGMFEIAIEKLVKEKRK